MAGGNEDSFIAPLGLLMGLTGLIALLLSYAKQSAIIAFITVGVTVNSLGVNVETTTLRHISEIGILILLFMAGLEVELEAFIKEWKTVTIIGVGQIVCSTLFFTALSFVVLPAIGAKVTTNSAIYFGLCMCFCSTILVLGYLKTSKSMGTVYGQLCLGTLVLQDATSVLGIAVLGGLATGTGTCTQLNPVDCQSAESVAACMALGSKCVFTNTTNTSTNVISFVCADACASLDLDPADDGGLAMCIALESTVCTFEEAEDGGALVSILVLFGKLIAACLICFILARYVLEKMFEAFARSLELLYLGSLGYATGLAAIAVTAGFSGEITAFLAGVSISGLPYKMHIETKMEPIKSLGVAIFFISLGLRLQVNQTMVDALPIGFALAVFTLFATLPLFIGLGFLAKLKARNVFMLGLLMNQISEFSLILCTLCVDAEVFEPVVLTVMTVAAVISIVFSSIGHIFIDEIYEHMRGWWCLRCIDAHLHKGFAKKLESVTDLATEITFGTPDVLENDGDAQFTKLRERAQSLVRERPSTFEGDEWAFGDQLKDRSTEQLQIDLKKTMDELKKTRNSMAATVDEKRFYFEKTTKQLYEDVEQKDSDDASRGTIIKTSHATDIMHGMIEGYVIIDHQLMFCTLRTGRMLFWREQNDVGYAPPSMCWDITGMAILNMETEEKRSPTIVRSISARTFGLFHQHKEEKPQKHRPTMVLRSNSARTFWSFHQHSGSHTLDSDVLHDEEVRPWKWTIVLGHINSRSGKSSIEDDTMKLTIHGLEDQSDHDGQDWRDALSVCTAMLNPIALRLAHIREELHFRRTTEEKVTLPHKVSADGRKAAHSHRNKIFCIGYNEMFPAVLALADGIKKDVIVVDCDPKKISTIKQLYNEEKRSQDYKDKRNGNNSLRFLQGEAEADGDKDASDRESEIKGVKCEYADIHDPECWEALEMDQAFMVVCTMKGALHVEKAILKWLRKHESDTIFIAYTQNNVEAIQLYQAGAHFVMQTDALAMRSSRDILMETVANVGDCSQLVGAGQAHKKRLLKLKKEDNLKFQYETGFE